MKLEYLDENQCEIYERIRICDDEILSNGKNNEKPSTLMHI